MLKVALPPTGQATNEGLVEIFQSLLAGTAQAWVAIQNETLKAAAITMIQVEAGTKVRNLLIYALCGYSGVSQDLWEEGFKTFKAFAKANDCRKIIAYSKVPRVMEIAQSLGASMDFRLLEWEV